MILTGDQPDCVIGAGASATPKSKSKKNKSSRFVWGKGKGKFRTTGNNGAATVRGTYWYTQDRCDGTFFRTREGVVDVRDFGKAETVPVKAGAALPRPRALREPPQLRHQAAGPGGPERRRRDGAGERQARPRARRRQAEGARRPARAAEAADPRADQPALSNGETLNGVREYRTCTPRVSDRTPPRL